jgi:hypothetical protein
MADALNLPYAEVRSGNIGDIEFITTALIEAVKGGTNLFLFDRIFGISESVFAGITREILKEEVPGSEFYCGHFALVTWKKEPVSCLCGWEEGRGGTDSSLLKGMMLSHFIGMEKWQQGIKKMEIISKLGHKRQKGAIQMETAYKDREVYRRMLASMLQDSAAAQQQVDVMKPLIDFIAQRGAEENPTVNLMQASVNAGNKGSIGFLERNGFEIKRTTKSEYPGIREFYPDDAMVLLEKQINIDNI